MRYELYDRRLAVYKEVKAFYGEIGSDGTAKYGMVMKFYAATAEAEFLFGDEIKEHIEELNKKGMNLASLHEEMYPSSGDPGLPVGPERSKVAKEHSELLGWFLKHAVAETSNRFRKYLRVD